MDIVLFSYNICRTASQREKWWWNDDDSNSVTEKDKL